MSSPVKKTTWDEYYTTFATVLKHIDKAVLTIKNRQKNLSVYYGFENYKTFLYDIENKAIEQTSKEMKLSDTAIRDRYKVLTMPLPVYTAIEAGEITFTQARFMTAINFCFDNVNDVSVAQEIVDEIKKDIPSDKIKDLVKSKSSKVWNATDIVMQRIMAQHGLNQKSLC